MNINKFINLLKTEYNVQELVLDDFPTPVFAERRSTLTGAYFKYFSCIITQPIWQSYDLSKMLTDFKNHGGIIMDQDNNVLFKPSTHVPNSI